MRCSYEICDCSYEIYDIGYQQNGTGYEMWLWDMWWELITKLWLIWL